MMELYENSEKYHSYFFVQIKLYKNVETEMVRVLAKNSFSLLLESRFSLFNRTTNNRDTE